MIKKKKENHDEMEKSQHFAKPGTGWSFLHKILVERLDHLIGDSKCPSVKSETSTMKRITLLSDDDIWW